MHAAWRPGVLVDSLCGIRRIPLYEGERSVREERSILPVDMEMLDVLQCSQSQGTILDSKPL
jgi:hypothetical protein